jgi:outer membrane protein assembly factor BamB
MADRPQQHRRVRNGRRVHPRFLTLLYALFAVALLASCGSSSGGSGSAPASSSAPPAGPAYPNGDLSNTRDVGGAIDSSSVARLETAWRVPLTAKSQYGSYASSPVVSDGVIYSQDLDSNVETIDLKSGKVLWTKTFESADAGPNGLVVAEGRVFGATTNDAFALDARTGRQLWSVELVRNEHEGIDMAPGYHDGLVYVSTVPGNTRQFYREGGVGILWALNAKTGQKVWHFDTAPEDLWSPAHREVNSGGGLWYTPAFDDEGSMYVGVANPGPFPGTPEYPWGSSRPGPNLYTDSLVKLDAKTGKVQWYYQLTPHDIYDWDLQDPPILTESHGRKLVLAAGKSGIVIAIGQHSGKLVWKRSVGMHNGHDHDSLFALKREYSKLHSTETVYPGFLGGVIAPMAATSSTVFVPVVNLPVSLANQAVQQEGPGQSGELVALDLATGAVKWKHSFESPAFGAVTVVNDIVIATTFDGKLYALDTQTGQVVWELQLPAGTNTGVTVAENMLIAPAGLAQEEGQSTEITAYRLGAASSK